MTHTKTDNTYIIRIDKGEQVIASITDFCKRHNIKNAHFTAIGAVEWISCGYYALSEKKYYFKQYDGLYEVISGTGNVALKEGAAFVHLHAVFSDEDNRAFGGHVEEMHVGVVLEVMLTILETDVERQLDEGIGLFLMNCGV